MSLVGALNIGKNALAVQQAAIQTTGNNIANAGNADYTRQVAKTSPGRDQEIRPGVFLGTGLNLSDVQRQIDEALESRLRNAGSESQAADISQQWLSRIEATFNELSDQDLSTQLSTFFNSWSSLANKPQDIGLRQVVIQNGQAVGSFLNHLRDQLTGLQTDVNDRVQALAKDANSLAQQVADLNGTIIQAEGGAGIANGLRDQRDAVLKQLSQLVNIKTVQQENGTVNVYVGSEPLVMAAENRGIATKDDPQATQVSSQVVFKANNGTMNITSGQIGALSSVQSQISSVAENIDKVAGSLIFELNKIHSSGQGLEGFQTTTGANGVNDSTVALNNKLSGLKFTPSNGSFVVHVRNKTSGLMTSSLVKVDLDGLNSNDTTLNSLVTDLNAVSGVSASINAGKLVVSSAGSDSEISFSQDSSGTLAALGMNSFFTGSTARDIGVNQTIVDSPNLLAASKNGEKGDNQTALAIAALETKAITALSGVSLKDNYQSIVNGVATSANSAKTAAEAANVVQQTLQAQRESLSGVSLDEEAVNLMRQQRAYQGAARLISVVNELMDEMMNMAR